MKPRRLRMIKETLSDRACSNSSDGEGSNISDHMPEQDYPNLIRALKNQDLADVPQKTISRFKKMLEENEVKTKQSKQSKQSKENKENIPIQSE